MRRAIGAAAVFAATISTTMPALAVRGLALGMSGGISVYSDLGACGTVTSSSPDPFVGTFSAVGEMQGPGTRIGTIRSVVPIFGTGSWHGCIPGAYAGATAGEVKFVLHTHGTGGEYIEIQQCVVNRGVVTCY